MRNGGGDGSAPAQESPRDKLVADTVVRNVKRLLRAACLSPRPCAGIPCGQTRCRHGWPKREAPLCAASLSPGSLCGNSLADKLAADTVGRDVKRLCAGIPCGQTRRRHGCPKREATLCGNSLADKPAAGTVGRDVKRPLRACRFAEEQSALARRPAFRRAPVRFIEKQNHAVVQRYFAAKIGFLAPGNGAVAGGSSGNQTTALFPRDIYKKRREQQWLILPCRCTR